MGSFANTLFSALLGWVHGVVAWLWKLVTSDGAGAFVKWISSNWLLLVILLCAAGIIVDLVVYLIRWQPYRVWASFGSRFSAPEEIETEDEAHTPRKWIYADGSTAMEEAPPQPQQPVLTDDHLQAPVRPVKRVTPARRRRISEDSDEYILPEIGGSGQAYHQPYYPPQWQSGTVQKDEGGNAP
ncbi:MAG: hypothetical protein IJA77_03795 [Clostridia bacterium]|nr:hypothetical protein [Clostridia bacterium]